MSSRMNLLSVVLCTAVCGGLCVAQSYPNFSVVNSPAAAGSFTGDLYTADLNNDGVPDLIANEYSTGNLQPYFAVFIANGDGTFKSPALYAYSPSSIPPGNTGPGAVPMTFGDFNGDGIVDVAMPVGNHTMAVYIGKGDGTLTNPWYSVLNLPSDEYVSFRPTMTAADFNHDGKVDLTVAAYKTDGSGETVYVLPGEGNGLFSQATPVLNFSNPGYGGNWGVQQVLKGDFDGDTNADLAIVTATGDSSGGSGTMTVNVLYGNGAFGFENTVATSGQGLPMLNEGDLNSDGRSDLFAVGMTYYGQWNRTFSKYTQQVPTAEYSMTRMAMGDFNGDGRNDYVTMARTYTSTFVVLFLGTGSPGQFTVQTWNVPGADYSSVPVAADFNRDGRPDWAYIGTNDTTVYTGLNTTVGPLWSDCDYPSTGRGLNLCSPAVVSGSTVNFNATAHSFGDVRKMELWVDGSKVSEQYHTWEGNAFFGLSKTFNAGTHAATYYAADTDNSLLRYDFQFTVPSDCSAPSTPGVHICWPTNGSSIYSKNVVVDASSTITGTLARMEIWVDGVKKYTETTSTSLSAAVTVTPGTHQFKVYAVNTSGTVWGQATTATIR